MTPCAARRPSANLQAVWQWQQVVPSSATLPPKRDMSAMLALSPTQLLLFGGRNEAGRSLADTWLFDLTT